MDPPVVIEVAALTKRFGTGVVAVDDLSFTVRRGEIVGLLGPNGAGNQSSPCRSRTRSGALDWPLLTRFSS